MKLFNGLFNRKKKLSKYKDERVKLLKFRNDLTDVVPVSYNGLFSVLDSAMLEVLILLISTYMTSHTLMKRTLSYSIRLLISIRSSF